ILENVPDGARMWTEEVFGPALPVRRIKDLDEGLRLANDSPFGLGSSIWTSNMGAAHRAVNELEAGYTWVNALQIAHDELPFGGGGDRRCAERGAVAPADQAGLASLVAPHPDPDGKAG